MRLYEIENPYGDEANQIFASVLKNEFKIKASKEDVDRIVSSLSASDVVAVTNAAVKDDLDTIVRIINSADLTEYAYPNRTGMQSAASNRQAATKREAPQSQTSGAYGKRTVAGGHKTATGRPAPAAPAPVQPPQDDVESDEEENGEEQ